MMERPASPRTSVESKYAFDHTDVEQSAPRAPAADLTLEDRLALGLSTPRIIHHAPDIRTDAAGALREVLGQGGAIGKTKRR